MALPLPASALPRDPPRPPPSRWRAGPPVAVVWRVVALVVVLHGLVLGAWPVAVDDNPPRPASGVQVRALVPAPAAPEPAPAGLPAPVAVPSVPAMPPVPAAPRAEPVHVANGRTPEPVAAALPEPAASAPVEPLVVPPEITPPPLVELVVVEAPAPVLSPPPVHDLPAASPAPAPPATPAPGEAGAVAASAPAGLLALGEGGEPLPVYPTRPAPSQTLSYQLRRGMLGGSAVLDWHRGEPGPGGAVYRMRLVARAAGFVLMTQDSEGTLDAAGLAPRRFTDQRLRGSARAANFQPERGRIGFSGPSVEYAWAPGVQDRLSWMLQLPAIIDANPRLASPGERITLAVIGARGDAAVWVFRFVAEEPVSTPAGERRALKFIREPRKANDTQAEVWLDPARHHLPLRARIGNPPDGEVLDLLRDEP